MDNFPLLKDIVFTFGLAVVVLLVCHKVRLPAIVGLLLTGVLCGPSALGIVSDQHAIELLSEIGVVLLMFTIGMELSGEALARLLKPIFIGGTGQVLLAVLAFTGIGMLRGGTWQESIMMGFLVALSSTAIVMNLLQQQAESESPQGRLTLSVLIFQDLAIVPMMLMVPLLAGKMETDAMSLALSAGRTLLILGGGWVLAKHVVPWIMRQVMHTRNRDLLLMTTLTLCLLVAIGTATLGLSLSLGAFLAGLLLAESEYSLSAVEGVLPFKTVFSSLFFISVGMLLDLSIVFSEPHYVVISCLVLIVGKVLVTVPALLLVGYPLRVCVTAALYLGQIGEFSFVLAKSGADNGLLSPLDYQLFLAGSILTMILTPFMMRGGQGAGRWTAETVSRLTSRFTGRLQHVDEDEPEGPKSGLRGHLIIVGFGVGGKHLARTAKAAGIPYVILEMNPDTVTRFGPHEPIHHGDASRPLVLEHFGIREARVLAVVISDPAAVRATASVARKLNPRLHIVVRTRFLGEVSALRSLGANHVIPEDFETSIEIFTRVLAHYLVPRQTIESFVHHIREENYSMSRKLAVHGSSLRDVGETLSGLEVTALEVEVDAPLAGKTLLESNLRREYNVTVVAVRRDNETIASPDGDFGLIPGDTVLLFAAQEAIIGVTPLFSAPGTTDEDIF